MPSISPPMERHAYMRANERAVNMPLAAGMEAARNSGALKSRSSMPGAINAAMLSLGS